MMSVLLDLVILAVLGLAVWRGMRRGLVLTNCGFLANFVGLVGASVTVDVLNEPVSRISRELLTRSSSRPEPGFKSRTTLPILSPHFPRRRRRKRRSRKSRFLWR